MRFQLAYWHSSQNCTSVTKMQLLCNVLAISLFDPFLFTIDVMKPKLSICSTQNLLESSVNAARLW